MQEQQEFPIKCPNCLAPFVTVPQWAAICVYCEIWQLAAKLSQKRSVQIFMHINFKTFSPFPPSPCGPAKLHKLHTHLISFSLLGCIFFVLFMPRDSHE